MKLIASLNAINSQVWAFLIVLVGCAAVISFHKAGIDIGIAAGIIGAGVNMFSAIAKAQQPGQHLQLDTNPDPSQPAPPPILVPTPAQPK